MDTEYTNQNAHPLGESSNKSDENCIDPDQRLLCDTYGGTVHVEWDPQTPLTPLGQLVFFIQFLKTCDLFKNWVDDCPIHHTSPNASKKTDILGTLLLAVLSGQNRYAHISAIRQDSVNPGLLGMKKVLSEDAIRRAFQNVDEDVCKKWQQAHLETCYEMLLNEKWILDIDTTVKVLYGNQEGAEIGYNPMKPGRPAHIIHSYMMSETRLILDSEVLPGKQSSSSYSLPRLFELLDNLPKEKHPTLVRGDCAFGNDPVLGGLEQRKVDYLFKLRQTNKVRGLIELCNRSEKFWTDAGQGWQGTEAEIKLTGWKIRRRVIVLRRRIEKKRGRKSKTMQLLLPFLGVVFDSSDYEYAVLVTTLNEGILTTAQLYRDRATCENTFDELKNQWGWSGFVTQDIKRSQIMARIITQIYNWWTLYVRWIDPTKHREAITSRPLMLYGVARQTKHAGQTTIKVTSMHARAETVQNRVGLINRFLNTIKSYAERLSLKERWRLILSTIFVKFLKGRLLREATKDAEMDLIEKFSWESVGNTLPLVPI